MFFKVIDMFCSQRWTIFTDFDFKSFSTGQKPHYLPEKNPAILPLSPRRLKTIHRNLMKFGFFFSDIFYNRKMKKSSKNCYYF